MILKLERQELGGVNTRVPVRAVGSFQVASTSIGA